MNLPLPFLRAILRARWDPAALDEARAIAASTPLDGDELVETAIHQTIAPLLYTIIEGKELMPPRVEEALRDRYVISAMHGLVRWRELRGVLGALAGEGIRAVLLKGAALVEMVYQDPVLRPMSDLDLLVERKRVPDALQALAALGYERDAPEFHPGYDLVYHKAVHLHNENTAKSALDVHWHLFDSLYHLRAVPMDWWWETAGPIRVEGIEAWILGSEALLLHLCDHAVRHAVAGHISLGRLQDVAEVIARARGMLDWQVVLARAAAYDLVVPVQQVLNELGTGWEVPIPPDVFRQLGTLRPSPAEIRERRLLAGAYPPVLDLWLRTAALRGPRERLRYLWLTLLPSMAYMRQRYGVRSVTRLPLAYAERLVRRLHGEI